ncbi:sentrin-specific protease 1-like [Melanaphis sacchari]|uniref:Sentrin-specific protease 1 n=1 Tax=Melanaphis sacchari TaxID=742174 RepID=A0A2H8TW99_9HEMI|nr:sentrin-specific protease 1-like [Melanaphis sacchari]XP_025197506.1 sentrin-specific protease 1-like [Melanaphis sacchari]
MDTTNNSMTDSDYYVCLNDTYINKYMNLIAKRSANKIYVFDSFFFTSLYENGYSRVHNWTKNVDIFKKKALMIPIYTREENRWSLVMIDMANKTMRYYDKFGKYNPRNIRLIIKYLKLEHFMRKGTFFKKNVIRTPTNICSSNIDILDSGLFICVIAEHLSRSALLLFSLNDMKRFHKQIVCDIKCDKISNLIPSFYT